MISIKPNTIYRDGWGRKIYMGKYPSSHSINTLLSEHIPKAEWSSPTGVWYEKNTGRWGGATPISKDNLTSLYYGE